MARGPRGDYIRVCAGVCKRLTRPPWMAKADAPDTIQRASATECHSCYRDTQRARGQRAPRTNRKGALIGTVRRKDTGAATAHQMFIAERERRLAKQQRKRVA